MKVKGLRWWIISLIGLATVINYIDRSAINIMWPYIYKEFGIADADNKNALALITTFFMVAYAIGQTVTGKMMDAIGTRLGNGGIDRWMEHLHCPAFGGPRTGFLQCIPFLFGIE
jgi:ACS family hexuronate transporter-like MFS transporter